MLNEPREALQWLDFECLGSSLKDENYFKRAGPSTNSTWYILKIARFVGPSVDYVLVKEMESVTGRISMRGTKPYFS